MSAMAKADVVIVTTDGTNSRTLIAVSICTFLFAKISSNKFSFTSSRNLGSHWGSYHYIHVRANKEMR